MEGGGGGDFQLFCVVTHRVVPIGPSMVNASKIKRRNAHQKEVANPI